MGIALRHCVRLGIIVEIESEFAGNEYRMKELRTNEVWWKSKEEEKMHWRTCQVRPDRGSSPAQLSGSG